MTGSQSRVMSCWSQETELRLLRYDTPALAMHPGSTVDTVTAGSASAVVPRRCTHASLVCTQSHTHLQTSVGRQNNNNRQSATMAAVTISAVLPLTTTDVFHSVFSSRCPSNFWNMIREPLQLCQVGCFFGCLSVFSGLGLFPPPLKKNTR